MNGSGLCDIITSKKEVPTLCVNFDSISGATYTPCVVSNVAVADSRFLYSHTYSFFFYQPVWQANRTDLKNELDTLYEECSIRNWDGYGAKPVYRSVRPTVEQFIDALPNHVPDPEICADPDGEISLEWYFDADRVFSVSIGRKKRLSFACVHGKNKLSGVTCLGDKIPEDILFQINSLMK